jgi:hypothetical protein
MSSSAEVSESRAGAPYVLPLYALTLFLSAFLLFSVQPMFTKMVLPMLGGSAAVWNTAVVFFQATLLLGYLYAHFSSTRLGPKAQAVLHLAVLLVGGLVLPLGVASGWSPPTGEMPILWLIGLLACSIGLPFFAVSATAPLLQKWFARTDHAAANDPYFLYGASNLGSLAALLSYPLVVERLLGLNAQASAWTAGYGALALVILACGVLFVRRHRAETAVSAGAAGLVAEVTWKLRLHWLTLSVVPSALLLGVTLHIGTNVVAVPFLWVLPLALYLFTFVLVFARRPLFASRWMLLGQTVFVALLAGWFGAPLNEVVQNIPGLRVDLGLVAAISLHVGAMFFTTLVCHSELAQRRPEAKHLTEYYLWMSLGGVVGGFLAAIVAPLVFHTVLEYPLALFAGLLLRPSRGGGWLVTRLAKAKSALARFLPVALDLAIPAVVWLVSRSFDEQALNQRLALWTAKATDQNDFIYRRIVTELAPGLILAAVLTLTAGRASRFGLGFLAILWYLTPEVLGNPAYLLLRERSFFGVYSVGEAVTAGGRFHILQNGTTNHGGQNLDRPLGALTYYTREGPVGQFFSTLKDTPAERGRIGVIGLGVGALACYTGREQRLTYYEIDPLDERIAREPKFFTYLTECGKNVDVVIGDGRLSLAREPDAAFDVLIVDAFSGDTIPAHLLTREAIALYFQKLTERGVLLLHVTNAYLDLLPVVGDLVAHAGLRARCSISIPLKPGEFVFPSDWVAIARTEASLQRLAFQPVPWVELTGDSDGDVWTDDKTNVLSALRLKR